MAFGKALSLRYFERDKPIELRETKPRNRALVGKARIKARREAK